MEFVETIHPREPEELAETLRCLNADRKTISLTGAQSKRDMGGPLAQSDSSVSTGNLNRVRKYAPADLTISVEAGLPFAELSRVLAENRQMVPLDPPCWETATVGGVLASNSSGPRRRLYGAARDLVIGMTFATLEGKLVQSGGMVVKNVAGLDMGKLMIGSFGTLAAIAVVNFKIVPMPPRTRTFALQFETLDEAIGRRDAILQSVLQPAALDLLNGPAAAMIGLSGCVLLLQAGGTPAVIDRYTRELDGARHFDADEESEIWSKVREFVPAWLAGNPQSAVVRASATLTGLGTIMQSLTVPVVARAASGVLYACFADAPSAVEWMNRSNARAVIEWAPQSWRAAANGSQWSAPGSEFEMMRKIKQSLDPSSLLNPGRLYGRI
jgi:glycolate dehydrogenase FAD-binding subunit